MKITERNKIGDIETIQEIEFDTVFDFVTYKLMGKLTKDFTDVDTVLNQELYKNILSKEE